MARPQKEVDVTALLDLAERGYNKQQMADFFGISSQTLQRRIADLQTKQTLLLEYRTLQSLQLTELQARVLEAITPDKINNASLKDLVGAFKILKDSERVIEGKPTEIRGLLGYLMEIEKEEFEEKTGVKLAESSVPVLDVTAIEECEGEYIPKL